MNRTIGRERGVFELRAIAVAWLGLFAVGSWFLGLHPAHLLPPADTSRVSSSLAPAPTRAVSAAPLARPPAAGTVSPGTDAGDVFWLSSRYRRGDRGLIDVVGVGDVMMGSRDLGLDPALTSGVAVSALVSRRLTSIFARSDIAIANLEGALFDGDEASAKDCAHCYAFRSPAWYARLLGDLGIRTVSLANNHSGDFGDEGRDATMAALRAHAIGYCGLDRNGARSAEVLLRNGARAAVIAFSPNDGTLDLNDPDRASALIRALRKTHAIVIVSFHGGAEGDGHVGGSEEYFDGEDRGNVACFAHAAIDAGADLVLGQGPHVPRAVEIYRHRLIAYSLGNFWTYGAIDTASVRGLGPVLETWLAPDGSLAGFAIHSTSQQDSDVPRLDPKDEAARRVIALTESDFPATAALLNLPSAAADAAQ